MTRQSASVVCLSSPDQRQQTPVMKTFVLLATLAVVMAAPREERQGKYFGGFYHHAAPYYVPAVRYYVPSTSKAHINFAMNGRNLVSTNFQGGQGPVNAEFFAKVVGQKAPQTGAVAVRTSDSSASPSLAAALAYMKSLGASDICSLSSQAYVEAVLTGKSVSQANAAATEAYITAYNAGARVEPGSACAASEASFRSNFVAGKATTQAAALAFIDSWPGLKQGNPCALSGKAYIEAITAGQTSDDASTVAASTYIDALNANPEALDLDEACARASEAFIEASS